MYLHTRVLAHTHSPSQHPCTHTHMRALMTTNTNSVNLVNGTALIFLNILLVKEQCADPPPQHQ